MWLDAIYAESLFWASPDRFPGAVNNLLHRASKRFRTEPRTRNGKPVFISELTGYLVAQRIMGFLLAHESADFAWRAAEKIDDNDLRTVLLAESLDGFFPPPKTGK